MGLLADAFGKDVQDVGTIVQTFDFSKVSTFGLQERTALLTLVKVAGNDILKCDLAPAFGKLDKATIREMDDQLKVMIAGAMMQLTKVRERSWQDVVAAMVQNMLLEPEGDVVTRAEQLTKDGTEEFKSDGIVLEVRVHFVSPFVRWLTWHQVQKWFFDLIRDEDVLVSTKLMGTEVLGKIVAQAGAAIRDFESLSKRHEYHEKTVLDIGVLRFPDLEQPYFKVCALKLCLCILSNMD